MQLEWHSVKIQAYDNEVILKPSGEPRNMKTLQIWGLVFVSLILPCSSQGFQQGILEDTHLQGSNQDEEVPVSEMPSGYYSYAEEPSPYFKGAAKIENVSGGYTLKAIRKFNTGATSVFQVKLNPDATEANKFSGTTKLYFPTKNCGGASTDRSFEARVFKDTESGLNLFYIRETGKKAFRCNYYGPQHPCECWWETVNYDVSHPKPYVQKLKRH